MFSVLRQEKALFKKIAAEQYMMPKVMFNHNKTVLSYNGHPLDIEKHIEAIKKQCDHAWASFKQLMRGCEYDDIERDMRLSMDPTKSAMWMFDEPQNEDAGYSLWSDKRNKWGDDNVRYRLLQHLCRKEEIFTSCEGRLFVDISRARVWMSEVDDLVKLVFVGKYQTQGGGARGTEMELSRYRNGPGIIRNYTFICGMMTDAGWYNKTNSVSGKGKYIVRAPAPEFALIQNLMITFLYPVASHITLQQDPQLAPNYFNYTYVLSGKPMSPEKMSKALNRFAEQYHNASHWGLAPWRTIKCCLLNLWTRCDFTEADAQDQDMSIAQSMFGHTPDIHKTRYANTGEASLHFANSTDVHAMIRLSVEHHKWIRMAHPSQSTPPQSLPLYSAPGAPGSTTVLNIPKLTDQFTNAVKVIVRQSLEEFGSTFNATFSQSRGNPIVTRFPPLFVQPQLIKAMQDLHLLPAVSPIWRSPDQAQLVQACTTGDHVIGIMPTGHGKTLSIYGGAAHWRMEGKAVAVISPLAALLCEQVRNVSQTKLKGVRFKDLATTVNPDIVFESIEIATGKRMMDWFEENKSHIGRMYFDEAHRILTDPSYREAFTLIQKFTEVGIPMTFLTATMLPESMGTFCEKLGIKLEQIRVIRRNTARPDIQIVMKDEREPGGTDNDDAISHKVATFAESIGDLAPNRRGIIFCRTKQQSQKIAELMNTSYYNSKIEEDMAKNAVTKQKIDQAFRDGIGARDRWIVCTDCYGEGLNNPFVDVVILVNPTSLMAFKQHMGRGGRAGQPCTVYVMWNQLPNLHFIKDGDHEGIRYLYDMFMQKTCPHFVMGRFDLELYDCPAWDKVWCTWCLERASDFAL